MSTDPLGLETPLPPSLRAGVWVAAVCALGAFLVATSPREPFSGAGTAEIVSAGAAALTAALAVLAAFQVASGASVAWKLVSLLPLAVWLAATALGGTGTGERWGGTLAEASQCLGFLCGVSLPLAALALAMLAPYRPPLRALLLGGLAAAAAAAALLNLVHAHASAPLDVAVHLLAAAIVLTLCAHAASWIRMRSPEGIVSSSK